MSAMTMVFPADAEAQRLFVHFRAFRITSNTGQQSHPQMNATAAATTTLIRVTLPHEPLRASEPPFPPRFAEGYSVSDKSLHPCTHQA